MMASPFQALVVRFMWLCTLVMIYQLKKDDCADRFSAGRLKRTVIEALDDQHARLYSIVNDGIDGL